MTENTMQGRVALVTGAESGIGRATAVAFARAGATVVGAGLDEEQGAETVELIKAEGVDGYFTKTDVTQSGQVEDLVSGIVKAHGRLDFAFNNAGISGESGLTGDISEDSWRQVIDVNLIGVWICMKYELQEMMSRGGGAIVNCSSALGHVGIAGSSAYVASKHGLLGLTKSAALEYAQQGIRINAVCPGFVHTPMIDKALGSGDAALAPLVQLEPIGRLGTPEEIADAVVWMCSDQASFMTGASMVVDGGWIAGYRFGQ